VEQPPIARDMPPQSWKYGDLTDPKLMAKIAAGGNMLFYPAKQLKLVTARKVEDKVGSVFKLSTGGTLPFPSSLLISQNWTRRHIASHRKLKNIYALLKVQQPDGASVVALLSLLEAQTLRHLMNHKKAAAVPGAATGEMLLQTLSGLPLTDPSKAQGPLHPSNSLFSTATVMKETDMRVLQSARFLNSEVWYNTHELISLLDQQKTAMPSARQNFFEQLQGSRRRIFKTWSGLPIEHLFTLLDSMPLKAQLELSQKLGIALGIDVDGLKKEGSQHTSNRKDRLMELLKKHDYSNSGWLTEEALAEAFMNADEMDEPLTDAEAKMLSSVTVQQAGQVQESKAGGLPSLSKTLGGPSSVSLTLSLKPSKLSGPIAPTTVDKQTSVVARGAAVRLLKAMMIQAADTPGAGAAPVGPNYAAANATGASSKVAAPATPAQSNYGAHWTGPQALLEAVIALEKADEAAGNTGRHLTHYRRHSWSGDELTLDTVYCSTDGTCMPVTLKWTRTAKPVPAPMVAPSTDVPLIQCQVSPKEKPFVLAAVKHLNKTTGNYHHVSNVMEFDQGWGPNGEYVDLTLWVCMGKTCSMKRIEVEKLASGAPGDVTL